VRFSRWVIVDSTMTHRENASPGWHWAREGSTMAQWRNRVRTSIGSFILVGWRSWGVLIVRWMLLRRVVAMTRSMGRATGIW
jgi:hypothetical protein